MQSSLLSRDRSNFTRIWLWPLCELIGVDWGAQRRRIVDDPVLGDVVMSVAVTATQIESERGQRKTQDMICLPLDYLNGWLFSINAKL